MHFDLAEVLRGKNLHYLGWSSGYLLVQFRGRSAQYIYGPNMPQEEYNKLMRVPYPDKLFVQTVRGKYNMKKIEAKG